MKFTFHLLKTIKILCINYSKKFMKSYQFQIEGLKRTNLFTQCDVTFWIKKCVGPFGRIETLNWKVMIWIISMKGVWWENVKLKTRRPYNKLSKPPSTPRRSPPPNSSFHILSLSFVYTYMYLVQIHHT
jgi:hypothetical protein